MKKESILSDEEKMQKWQKIKDNRAKKMSHKGDRTQGRQIWKSFLFSCTIKNAPTLAL
jgi:hypothetical protein